MAADDAVRDRLRHALAADGLAAAGVTGVDGIEDVTNGDRVDVVVVACQRADGRAAAIRAVRERLTGARVVVVAAASLNGIHKSLEAGADGFVHLEETEPALAATVHAVCAGQVVIPPAHKTDAVRTPLTHREKQALQLLTLGMSNAEIARRLFLAESTVKSHVTSIFSKLGVRSRSEAVARALDPEYSSTLHVIGTRGDAANR